MGTTSINCVNKNFKKKTHSFKKDAFKTSWIVEHGEMKTHLRSQ